MTALRREKAYFTESQILASKDRWEMNAAHLVLRLNMCIFRLCMCLEAHFLLDFMGADTCNCVRVFFCVCMRFHESSSPPVAVPPNYSDLHSK